STVFFFQAEDGIRDGHVTGVQTCALPIFNLAIHTAGLPRDPSNLTPTRGLPENAFADYTVEKLYAFLSSFTLDREPGSKFEYSNVGMALLGPVVMRHSLALTKINAAASWCYPVGKEACLPKSSDGFCSK